MKGFEPGPRDIDKAKGLVKQSGVPTPIPVTIMVPNVPDQTQLAEVLQSMVSDAGFEVKINPVDTPTSLSLGQQGNFEGYTKASETEKKILHDVFKKGDAWFRTGDLMRRDEHGYFFFVDRIGDTYRWKGENVATSEVTEALSVIPGVREANVYGVTVPGMDGRAGMAALVVDGMFDIPGLGKRLALPHYEKPVFLRLQPEIAVTGTFKQRKVELVKDGFDPSALPDPVYWLNPASGRYEQLTPAIYAAIVEDKIKI